MFADGRRLLGTVFKESGDAIDLGVRTLPGGEQQLFPGFRRAGTPKILPDGKRFVVDIDGRLVVGSLDGSQHDLYVPAAGRTVAFPTISRDNRWISWRENADESDIWMATLP